jgi:hypothetical protein
VTGGDAPEQHPDLGAVGAEMRAQWRAETEAATDDAIQQWRHSRRLDDWLGERMHAGDRIACTVLNQRFSGMVEEIGDDVVGIRAAFGRVEVHRAPGIPIFIEIDQHATSGGERATSRRTLRDALIAHDGHDDMSIGTLHEPQGLDGTLYVGQDFISVVTRMGAETVVPLEFIAWIAPRR